MKVCFVGVGSIGKRHIRNLRFIAKEDNISLEIHALRRKKGEADSFEKEYIDIVKYDFIELDDKYDAIFVTNPTFLHYETIKRLKDKSKYFFVEKPVFDSCNIEYKDIIDEENTYYVACPLRYTEIIKFARKIVADNKVINMRAICSSYLPEWRPESDYRKTYSAHKDEGGGVEIDLIHEWDYISYLFGQPLDVKKIGGKYSDLEIDSDDLAVYLAEYESMIVELHLDYFGRVSRRNFEIQTNDALYFFDFISGKIEKNGIVIEQFDEKANDKYIKEIRFFLDIMNGKEQNTNTIEHAVDVMRISV